MELSIRRAVPADLGRLTDIYNQAVSAGYCTCDTENFSPEERVGWFSVNDNDRTPVFVWEEDGAVVGYSYLSLYRGGRPAVKDTAEISYYIDFDHLGKGIGTKLFEYTLDAAKILGYKSLVAILLSCNDASIGLLEKFGFEQWGRMPDIAWTNGKAHSHLYYGRKI